MRKDQLSWPQGTAAADALTRLGQSGANDGMQRSYLQRFANTPTWGDDALTLLERQGLRQRYEQLEGQFHIV